MKPLGARASLRGARCVAHRVVAKIASQVAREAPRQFTESTHVPGALTAVSPLGPVRPLAAAEGNAQSLRGELLVRRNVHASLLLLQRSEFDRLPLGFDRAVRTGRKAAVRQRCRAHGASGTGMAVAFDGGEERLHDP